MSEPWLPFLIIVGPWLLLCLGPILHAAWRDLTHAPRPPQHDPNFRRKSTPSTVDILTTPVHNNNSSPDTAQPGPNDATGNLED